MNAGDPVNYGRLGPSLAQRRLPAIITLVAVLGLGVFAAIDAPSAAPIASPGLDSPVEGVVTAIDSAGLGQVSEFTLRLADASFVTFTVGTLEKAAGFPPGHLAEHQATSQQVRVYFRVQDGHPVAYRLEDAR